MDKKRKIRDFLLYGGKTKNEYKDAEYLILTGKSKEAENIFRSQIVFLESVLDFLCMK